MPYWRFEILVIDCGVLWDKPLILLQPAVTIQRAWQEAFKFEWSIWKDQLVSIKFVGKEP